MNPLNVLRMAVAMSGTVKNKVLLVGCEPATFGGEEGHMGLSEPVEAAVENAVKMVAAAIEKSLAGTEVNRIKRSL